MGFGGLGWSKGFHIVFQEALTLRKCISEGLRDQIGLLLSYLYYLLLPCKKQNQKCNTAATKAPQSCLTLCDPRDGSPPGSPVPGILQARTLEWVAISFSNAWKWKVNVKSLSRVQPSATPWTAAFQALPSIGFSRQEYWSGVPLPSPKNVNRVKQLFITLPDSVDKEFGKGTAKAAYLCPMVSETPVGKTWWMDAKSVWRCLYSHVWRLILAVGWKLLGPLHTAWEASG